MQKSRRNTIAIIIFMGFAAVIALIAYILRPTVAPSGEISAVAIETATVSLEIEQAPTAQDQNSAPEATLEIVPTEEIKASETSFNGTRIYEIEQSSSRASFTIREILNGKNTTVLGVTDQVAGQILLDFDSPGLSQIGLIQINARTLVTNKENRNRAIRNYILDVDEFEYISFETTLLEGLPEVVEIGPIYEIVIRGNLTIRQFTNEVTFDASITIESDLQISGEASTEIQRADYGLTIPEVPSVAGVEEKVILEIDFVAFAQ